MICLRRILFFVSLVLMAESTTREKRDHIAWNRLSNNLFNKSRQNSVGKGFEFISSLKILKLKNSVRYRLYTENLISWARIKTGLPF